MQYKEGCICSMRRRLCSVKRECMRRESVQYQEGHICSMSRENIAVPGLSDLQYGKQVVKCKERVYNIRRPTSAIGR